MRLGLLPPLAHPKKPLTGTRGEGSREVPWFSAVESHGKSLRLPFFLERHGKSLVFEPTSQGFRSV